MITFEDFKKLEIKIGKIFSAERVEGTDKFYLGYYFIMST